MGAITPTIVSQTPLAAKRILILTATIASASDQITLSLATHGVRTIYGVWPVIEAGMDEDFQTIQASFSDLVITLTSKEGDGTAADEFTGTTVRLLCIVD